MKLSPEIIIESILHDLDLKYEKEYRFCERRWRFDYCIPALKVGIEYEGGTYTAGGHVRGKHYFSDCQKYNFATLDGWKVLRYTTDIKKDNGAQFMEDLKFIINKKRA